MAFLDLKDAYFHVPIQKDCQEFLRFAVVRNSALPVQGPSLRSVISPSDLHQNNVGSHVFFPQKGNPDRPISRRLSGYRKLRKPGLKSSEVHPRKLLPLRLGHKPQEVGPGPRILKNLFWYLPEIQGSVFLSPRRKAGKIQVQTNSFLSARFTSSRSMMSLLGLLTSSIPAVRWAQAHSRTLQGFLLSVWDGLQSSLNHKVPIPSHVKNSLRWWTHKGNLSRGVSWVTRYPLMITTDTSHWGWGAHSEDRILQGAWSRSQAFFSSNQKELTAVWEALKVWSPLIQGRNIRILSDNSGGQGNCHSHSPLLASKGLVSTPSPDGDRRTMAPPRSRRSSSPRTHLPSSSVSTTSSGLDVERGILKSKGLSDSVISTLLQSMKPITFFLQQYYFS